MATRGAILGTVNLKTFKFVTVTALKNPEVTLDSCDPNIKIFPPSSVDFDPKYF